MKKADIKIGVEYAVIAERKRIPEGGISAMTDRGFYGSADSFPLSGIARVRIINLDTEVTIPGRFRWDAPETKKMIKVEWIETGFHDLDRATRLSERRLGHYRDRDCIPHAGKIFCTWDEFAPEYARRAAAANEQRDQNAHDEANRDRVLAVLGGWGVAAEAGKGYSTIEIRYDEIEKLLDVADEHPRKAAI